MVHKNCEAVQTQLATYSLSETLWNLGVRKSILAGRTGLMFKSFIKVL